ncbi:MAG: hypothetical protein OQK67_04530 [Chlorobium sp.]|nr:hypothetical protein [Chlorobium sp.]MCW8818808.1 hypothetical protein [Ignavibacteriaceae bacterium]
MKNSVVPFFFALAGYLLLVAGLFYPVVFQGQLPASPDSVSPMATSLALDAVFEQTGHYPLWQPWSFSGMPTVEAFTYLNGLYYPGVFFNLFNVDGLTLQLLHFVFAGLGGFVLLRRFRLHAIAAFLGGAAFMLTPYMVTMFVFGHGSQLMTAAYMPWILWAGIRLLDTMHPSDMGLLALLAGLQLQRGHVQIAYYTWILLFFLILLQVATAPSSAVRIRQSAMAFVALCIAIVISSSVYLPVFEYTPYSVRGSGAGGGAAYEYATMWSMHPLEYSTFLLPGAFGFGGITYWGRMPFTDFPNYAGIVVLLLALTGLVVERKKIFVRLLALSMLLMAFLAFGKFFSPVYDLFYHVVPFFSRFRVPSMALIVVSLNLSLLAGFGLHALMDGVRGKGTVILKSGALLLAVCMLVFLLAEKPFEQFLRSLFPAPPVASAELAGLINQVRWDLWKSGFLGLFCFGAFFTFLVWLRSKKILGGALFALLVSGLAVFDLLLVDRQVVTPSGKALRPSSLVSGEYLEQAFAEDGVTRFFEGEQGLFRIYPAGRLFGENKFSVFGIESAGGYHPAKLQVYDEMLRASQNLSNIDLLRMLNVRYVVSMSPLDHPLLDAVYEGTLRLAGGPVEVTVYRLSGAMERAWFVREGVSVREHEDVYGSLLSGGVAIPRQALIQQASWEGRKQFGDGRVVSIDTAPEKITLSVVAEQDAFLVLSEIYYPLRWKAEIDGTEQKVFRVNGIVRGVQVPAGEHDVVFSFDRKSFENGRKLSLAGFMVGLLLTVSGFSGYGRWRRMR